MLKLFFLIGLSFSTLARDCINLEIGQTYISEKSPHIIELYTSEGCSSCPPADKWLNNLKSKDGLWDEFIPLKFHVDYWNYIGWKDPFSSPENTYRQRSYARVWKAGTIYTPEFVLNSKEWRGWFKKVPRKKNQFDGKITLKRIDKNTLQFSLSEMNHIGNFNVLVLEQINNASHRVLRGENRGKTLKHHFSIVNRNRSTLKKINKSYTTNIKLESTKNQSYFSFLVERTGIPGAIHGVGGICVK
jgi:hypothetical protein